jgi:hypothetical protein
VHGTLIDGPSPSEDNAAQGTTTMNMRTTGIVVLAILSIAFVASTVHYANKASEAEARSKAREDVGRRGDVVSFAVFTWTDRVDSPRPSKQLSLDLIACDCLEGNMMRPRIQPALKRRSSKRVFAGARIFTCMSHEFVSTIQFVSIMKSDLEIIQVQEFRVYISEFVHESTKQL